ncbi:MAG: DUF4175 family protein, partial [Stellaceae bacterium]
MRNRQRPDFVTRSETQLRFTARLRLARLALAWERLWPALWPTTFVAGAFVVLALFDIPAYLPDWAAMALLGVFVAALIASLAGA